MKRMKEEDLKVKISSITSLSYFHHCQIHEFKKEIECHLKALVECSCCSISETSSKDGDSISCSTRHKCSSQSERIDSNIVHYKQTLLADCLHSWIDWKQLCKNHDNNECKRNPRLDEKGHYHNSSITALKIILECFVNQSVIPYCFTQVILVGLFHVAEKAIESQSLSFATNNYQVYIEKYIQESRTSSSRNQLPFIRGQPSSSLQLIYSVVISLKNSRDVAISLSSTFNFYTLRSNGFKSRLSSHMAPKQTGKQMKQYLKAQHSSSRTVVVIEMLLFMKSVSCLLEEKEHKLELSSLTSLVMIILTLLCEIDNIDVAMLQRKQRAQAKSQQSHLKLCAQCNIMMHGKLKKRNITTSQLSALHGELSDVEEQQYSLDCRRKLQRNKNYHFNIHNGDNGVPCSFKALVSGSNKITKSMKEKQSCYICMVARNRKSSKQLTTFPIHLVCYRAFLFHSLVDITRVLSSHDIMTSKVVLNRTLSVISKRPESSSLRYCAILIAQQIYPRGGDKRLLTLLLSLYKGCSASATSQRERKLKSYVYMYCEIIIQCASFDDPNECWLALKPLIDEAISSSLKYEKDVTQIQVGSPARLILQCIAYVLLKRNFLAFRDKMTNEISLSLNEYVLKLSEMFSDAEIWIHPLMTYNERSNTILMLQQLDILSFLQTSFDNCDKTLKNTCELWPYADSIRDASNRIGPKVQCQQIFTESDCSIGRKHKISSIKSGRNQSREYSITDEGSSIIDCINEDITRVIFSFLGYKLLVRVTGVCKLWNEIGNKNYFWKAHYKKRFKIISLHEYLPKDIDNDTKSAFVAKYCDERDLKWRQLFDEKWEKDRSLGPKSLRRRDNGCIVKTCDVLGCLTVLSSAKRQEIHLSMHRNNVKKKLRQLQRLNDRKEKHAEKERKRSKVKEEGSM